MESFYEQINPTMIHIFPDVRTKIFTKIKAGTELQTISQFEEAYEELSKGAPFNFSL